MPLPGSELSVADIERRQLALRDCPDLFALPRRCSDLVIDYQSSAQADVDQLIKGGSREDKRAA